MLGEKKCRLSCDKEFWHLLNGRSTDRLVLIWSWWGEDGEGRGGWRRGLSCCENADQSAVFLGLVVQGLRRKGCRSHWSKVAFLQKRSRDSPEYLDGPLRFSWFQDPCLCFLWPSVCSWDYLTIKSKCKEVQSISAKINRPEWFGRCAYQISLFFPHVLTSFQSKGWWNHCQRHQLSGDGNTVSPFLRLAKLLIQRCMFAVTVVLGCLFKCRNKLYQKKKMMKEGNGRQVQLGVILCD